jgi:hypothetical protein
MMDCKFRLFIAFLFSLLAPSPPPHFFVVLCIILYYRDKIILNELLMFV